MSGMEIYEDARTVSRGDLAAWLRQLASQLDSGAQIFYGAAGTVTVADQVHCELEIEREDGEISVEIEFSWASPEAAGPGGRSGEEDTTDRDEEAGEEAGTSVAATVAPEGSAAPEAPADTAAGTAAADTDTDTDTANTDTDTDTDEGDADGDSDGGDADAAGVIDASPVAVETGSDRDTEPVTKA